MWAEIEILFFGLCMDLETVDVKLFRVGASLDLSLQPDSFRLLRSDIKLCKLSCLSRILCHQSSY